MIGIFGSILVGILVAVGIGLFFNQKTIGGIVGAAIAIAGVLFNCVTVIPAGHVGVQVTLGEVNPVALSEGVHVINPISFIRDVEVRLQKYQLDNASASTKDLQQVHTSVVVNFRLNGEHAPRIFKEFGLNVDDKVLGPAINEAFKAVTAHYNSEELITKRDEVSQAIHQAIASKVAPFNMDINNTSLVNFGFSAEYAKAIEAKVIATQQKQKAEQDLQRIEVEAKSRVAQAKGEAEAIAIQAQAIQSNGGQQYVQLQWINKWDGKMPSTMLGNGQNVMMSVGK